MSPFVRAKASHILLDSLELAQRLKAKINDYSDFENLAKQHSLCPSGRGGGYLSSFAPGKMVAPFDALVFCADTPIGVVQGPIQTQFGYHLIWVVARV